MNFQTQFSISTSKQKLIFYHTFKQRGFQFYNQYFSKSQKKIDLIIIIRMRCSKFFFKYTSKCPF